jgi:hypothetical protein
MPVISEATPAFMIPLFSLLITLLILATALYPVRNSMR